MKRLSKTALLFASLALLAACDKVPSGSPQKELAPRSGR